jgi:ABC-type hemin transport system ATPase subunit
MSEIRWAEKRHQMLARIVSQDFYQRRHQHSGRAQDRVQRLMNHISSPENDITLTMDEPSSSMTSKSYINTRKLFNFDKERTKGMVVERDRHERAAREPEHAEPISLSFLMDKY